MTALDEQLHQVAAEAPEDDDLEPDDQDDDLEPDEVEDEPDEPEAQATGLPVFDPTKLEAEQRRHERAMAKVFGDSWAAMTVCDGCGGLGHVPQGLEAPPELQTDPDVVVCDACAGLGVRKTGSWADRYQTIPCTVCSGQGYRGRAELEAAERAAQYQHQQQQPGPPGQPVWDGQLQQWVTAPQPGYGTMYPPPPPPYSGS